MRRADMKIVHISTIPTLPKLRNVGIKSHLSGLRQRKSSKLIK